MSARFLIVARSPFTKMSIASRCKRGNLSVCLISCLDLSVLGLETANNSGDRRGPVTMPSPRDAAHRNTRNGWYQSPRRSMTRGTGSTPASQEKVGNQRHELPLRSALWSRSQGMSYTDLLCSMRAYVKGERGLVRVLRGSSLRAE